MFLFNVSVNFTQTIFLLRKFCQSKGHLRVQDSFDDPVQLPSFSPVEEIIYFTAVCVTATPPAEDISGVIGKSETEIPCQDYLPSCERRVGEFPYQSRRQGHLQLHITESEFLTISKFNSLQVRSFSATQTKHSKFLRPSF